jgi:hypothetical protein
LVTLVAYHFRFFTRGECGGESLEDLEDYVPFLPNSPEGSPEGSANNEVASEIRSSTPLEESILPVNPLLNLREDPIFLWLNSLGEIVTEDHTKIPTRPHADSGVDNPLFQSESFRTMVHTAENFNPSSPGPSRTLWKTSSGQDISDKIGMSHLHLRTCNQPMAS